jgi:MOSC domain-containing protein YiiM
LTVVRIFVAPMKGAPMRELKVGDALAGQGLEGDRKVAPGREPAAQLTLIEAEHIEAFRKGTGFEMRDDQPRRILVTRGVRLNGLLGKRFRVGEALCEGLELCEPCGKFQRLTHPEVRRFFKGKGGLRATILDGGAIRQGDTVVVVPDRGRTRLLTP